MNGKCFEIGAIQAFLDGETAPELSLRLADHVEQCDACARLMATAEEENSVVFSALERELDTLVPTQRLWSRINDSIVEEKSHAPYWQRILGYIRIALANPSLTAAAGILLVMGMFAVVVSVSDNALTVADLTPTSNPSPTTSVTDKTTEVVDVISGDAIPSKGVSAPVGISNLSPKEMRTLAANVKAGQREIKPQYAIDRAPATDAYLPGEESYVKTISDLKQNVDDQKDAVLTPSSRVSYERDMAVVNDSIKRMREVVKKNPRNQAARQVLYSSYQDKIDLLNSVAQREELIASLR